MISNLLDLDSRAKEAAELALELAQAISDNDETMLAYILGRLDQRIPAEDTYGSYKTEKLLRRQICVVLDMYPDPHESAQVVEIQPDKSA